MSKELFISTSPHETKVAVLEDEQLVEFYVERDTDVGLVGGIYKGRVSRVLPGMQSAFVDIGLERDAFLYVSDFFLEDQDEYDKVFEEAETRAGTAPVEAPAPTAQPAAPATPPPAQAAAETGTDPILGATPAAPAELAAVEAGASQAAASSSDLSAAAPSPTASAPAPRRPSAEPYEQGHQEQRGRRRRRRGGRHFNEHTFAPRREFERPHSAAPAFEVLPGESLAKYSHQTPAPAETSGRAPEGNLTDVQTTAPAESQVGPPAPVPESFKPGSPAASAPSVAEEEYAPEPNGPNGPNGEDAAEFQIEEAVESFPTPDTPVRAESFESSAQTSPVEEPMDSTGEPDPWRHDASAEFEHGSATKERTSEIEIPVAPAGEAECGTASEPANAPEAAAHEEPRVVEQQPSEAASGQAEAADTRAAGAPTERTYTYREPHHRPRFAPRRRRGRGMGHRRSQGGRREPSRSGNHQPRPIAELLKEGQEVLVQIAKEPLGTKGARITSHIALPGRYVVYMPTINHIGVSRKIASEEERLRLRNVILDNKGSLTGGFIVRTAGAGRSDEELKADLKFLATSWAGIRAKAEQSRAPALIHRDLDLVQRILRDVLSLDFKSVRVDSEGDYERVLEFVNRCQPALVGAVKLYTRDTPLFEEFGVQSEIEKALKPKVWLKSGGYIVINQTEALVAIDVNTGKYVGKTNRLEDTILKTNIDAVQEIVRQVRLRDLGGIIVIDFIDMDERRNRFKVSQELEAALHRDRAPTKIVTFNEFGLVAITRKRVKQSLERTLCEPCNYCSGAGWIKSPTSVSYEILDEARKMAKQIGGEVLTLRVNPEVAKALKSHDGRLIAELERTIHKDIVIKSDPTVHQERFEIF